MSINLRDGLLNQPIDHVLEDILVRFVVNVPKEDLSSLERVFFQVEEGQWFYTDFVRILNPSLPSMKMKSFAPRILRKCPLVWKWGDPSEALSQFGKYKSTIPVRGIALLNKDLTKVLLVRGPESGTWSFPRGKISKDETDIECAIREVREETSFDARQYVNENDALERTIGGKNFRIYLAKDVPEDFNFEPIVRCEIADIKWFNIKQLRKSVRMNHNKFYVVNAMMEPLYVWVNKQKGSNNEMTLMREAELKLKQLMGITPIEPEVNNDAGRELLNILQGSKPQELPITSGVPSWNEQVKASSLPQQLSDIYAAVPQFFPSHLPPISNVPHPNFPLPSFNGVMAQPPQPYQHLPQQHSNIPSQIQETSLPDSKPLDQETPDAHISKAPNATHSKELLSILKGKPFVKAPSNETKSEVVKTSNSKKIEAPTGKITLLKRGKTSSDNESATLLSILGKKPPSPDSPKSLDTDPDTNPVARNAPSFLNILNQGRKGVASASTKDSASGFNALAKTGDESTEDSSRQILNILKKPPTSEASEKSLSTPAQFLSILKKNSDSQPSSTVIPKSSPTEAIHGQSHQELSGNSTAPNPELNSGNQLLAMLNRKVETPRSAQQFSSTPTPVITDYSKFENFDDFENFEDFDDISESQKGIYNSIANNFDLASDEDDFMDAPEFELPKANPASLVPQPLSQPLPTNTNSAGAGLLLLLNGNNPPKHVPYVTLQDTYGANTQQEQPHPPVFPMDNRSNTNGAQILRLLKRDKQ